MAASSSDDAMSCFIVGYTGGTGKELLKICAKSDKFNKIVCIGRRVVDLDPEISEKCEQKVVDFENLEASKEVFQGLDVGYCCLGTTRTQSGREGFIKVDRDYITSVAEIAMSCGVPQFHLVSSVGANKDSCFLYTRIKGEVDYKVSGLGFQNLFIYRPKLLLRDNPRAVERLTYCLTFPIHVCSPVSMLTPTPLLASAMLNCTQKYEKPSQLIMTNIMIYSAAEGDIPKQDE